MKRGFNNRYKTHYALVSLETLQERFDPGDEITPEKLHNLGIIRRTRRPVKVVGDGELQHGLNISAHKFTASARGENRSRRRHCGRALTLSSVSVGKVR